MKAILVLISLCTLQAFAAPGKTTLQTSATVDVHDLACVQRATTGIYTDLRATGSSVFLGAGNPRVIQLQHPEASAEGCEISQLKAIETKANQFFGFLHDVPVTVEQTLSASVRNAAGACVASLMEDVTMTLESSVVLKSSAGKLIPATDCP